MAFRRHYGQWLASVTASLCLSWVFLMLAARENFHATQQLEENEADAITESEVEPCSNEERLSYLSEMCKRHNVTGVDLNSPQTYSRILVDDHSKVLYCVIGKSGCTTWKALLVKHINSTRKLNLSQKDIVKGVFLKDFLAKVGLVFMHTLPIKEIKYRVKNYFKFMVVRHPFDRLVSAYLDKMIDNDYKGRRFPRFIIEKYGTEEQKKNIDDANPRFDQFLKYVLKDSQVERDMHWEHYDTTCNPCSIRYDYIGKLETMDEDAPHILSRIDKTLEVGTHLPSYNKMSRQPHTDVLTEYEAIPEETLDALYDFYKRDFGLFGYSFDIRQRKAKCEIPREDGETCC